MQGGEGEMAGFGDPQRGLDGLEVAHLADENDIGILPQAGSQGVGEAVGVGVQLTLVDDALLVAVQVLDRILDRDDVLGALAIHLVEHRGEGGRLAGAGRAGDQHQAARLLADLLHHRRQAELAKTADLVRNLPEGRGDRAALMKDVGPEAGQTLDAEREVELEILFQAVLLVVRQDRIGDLFGLGGRERRKIERLENAVDANLRRRVGRDVEIRPPLLDHRLQHLSSKSAAWPPPKNLCDKKCQGRVYTKGQPSATACATPQVAAIMRVPPASPAEKEKARGANTAGPGAPDA